MGNNQTNLKNDFVENVLIFKADLCKSLSENSFSYVGKNQYISSCSEIKYNLEDIQTLLNSRNSIVLIMNEKIRSTKFHGSIKVIDSSSAGIDSVQFFNKDSIELFTVQPLPNKIYILTDKKEPILLEDYNEGEDTTIEGEYNPKLETTIG